MTIIPNSFQSPNDYVDRACRLLGPTEFKCLIVASREILGYQEKINERRGKISVSRFVSLTGLSRGTVVKDIESLQTYGFFIPVGKAGKKGQEWQLGVDIEWQQLEQRHDTKRKSSKEQIAKVRAARGKTDANGLSHRPLNDCLADMEAVYGIDYHRSMTKTSTGLWHRHNKATFKANSQNQKDSSSSDDAATISKTPNFALGAKERIHTFTEHRIATAPPPTPNSAPPPPANSKTARGLIAVWLKVCDVVDPGAYGLYQARAQILADRGVVPADIADYVKYLKTQDFWRDKAITFAYIATNIITWKNNGGVNIKPIGNRPAIQPAPSRFKNPLEPELEGMS